MASVLEFPALGSDETQCQFGCAESVALARSFIMSCLNALDSCQSYNFNARFENYVRHRAECEKCNIVKLAGKTCYRFSSRSCIIFNAFTDQPVPLEPI